MSKAKLTKMVAVLASASVVAVPIVLGTHASASASTESRVVALRNLWQPALAAKSPSAGRTAAIQARAGLAPKLRKQTSVTSIAHQSFTVRVGAQARCVSWWGGQQTVSVDTCSTAWKQVTKMGHRAALRHTATSGRHTAIGIRAHSGRNLKRVTHVSSVNSGRLTLTVSPYRVCVTWPGSGRAVVTGGLCPRIATDSAKAPGVSSTPSSDGPTLFGFYPGLESASDSRSTAHQRFDQISTKLGTPGVYRIYFDGLPPTKFAGSKADFGVPVVLSFKAPPAKVAAGDYDAQLLSFFNSIPSNQKVWWSFYHEPEDNIENGEFTAAQYRAAWDHLEKIVPKRANLKATLILMSWDLQSKVRSVSSYVTPGLDVLAWDAYVRTWSPSIGSLYDQTAKSSASYGLGFGIAETSVDNAVPNPPSRESVVRDVVGRGRADHAQFVTWFETTKDDGDWRLIPYTSAAALWKQLT